MTAFKHGGSRPFLLRLLLSAFTVICIAPGLASESATTACSRTCLLNLASLYMDSLGANDATAVPFAEHVRATENGQPTAFSAGIWATARGWRYRHTFVDSVTGEIGAFGVISEGGDEDAMIALRLKVIDSKIAESELLVTRKGDFALFQPRAASEPRAAFGGSIPADRRESRAALEAVPRHYFEAIARGDPNLVAVHPDANRIENGVQTTNNPDFGSPSVREGLRRLIYMQRARALRVPVVDPEAGLAFAIVAVDMPEMTRTLMIRGKPVEINPQRQHLPRTLFLFELFRIEDGQITAIEAVMRNMPLGADMGWPG